MIEEEPKAPLRNDKTDRNSNKSQSRAVIAKKNKNNYSQIEITDVKNILGQSRLVGNIIFIFCS